MVVLLSSFDKLLCVLNTQYCYRVSCPSSSTSGARPLPRYLRTDQLDGETDWKVREAVPSTQTLEPRDLARMGAAARVEAPRMDLYAFHGRSPNGSASSIPAWTCCRALSRPPRVVEEA